MGGFRLYKAVEIARLLQKRGHRVQAVMTKGARRFVGPLTFEAITREPVITSQFAPGLNATIEHIALASEMDVLLVAPATANAIGKLANGIAVSGPASLRDALVSDPTIFVTTMTERLLTYALGRGLGAEDMPTVRNIVRASARSNYRFSSLVANIVTSAPFQMRVKESVSLEP